MLIRIVWTAISACCLVKPELPATASASSAFVMFHLWRILAQPFKGSPAYKFFAGRRLIAYFLLSVLMANMSARNQTAPVRTPRSKLIISGRPLIRCGSAKSNAVPIKAIATETTFIGGSFTSAYNSYVPAAMFRPGIPIAFPAYHA